MLTPWDKFFASILIIACIFIMVTFACAAPNLVTVEKDERLPSGTQVIFEKRRAIVLGKVRYERDMPVYSIRVYNQEALEPKWSMIEAFACELTLPAER